MDGEKVVVVEEEEEEPEKDQDESRGGRTKDDTGACAPN